MQPGPPPKFSSFAPPAPSGPAATAHANHRSRASSNERPSRGHDSSREEPHPAGSHHPDRASQRDPKRKRHKERSHHGSKRRDELRVMDKIAKRPTTAQLENSSRRPSQFTLEDCGISFYEDPYGDSGTLFLEVKYWPPSQGAVCPCTRFRNLIRDNRLHRLFTSSSSAWRISTAPSIAGRQTTYI